MVETLTPPIEPSIGGAASSYRAKVNRAEFEGYSQRSKLGPNHVAREVTLRWNILSKDDREAIKAFLRARGGSEAFLYLIPGEAAPLLWTCAEWSEDTTTGEFYGPLTAKLTQEFDI